MSTINNHQSELFLWERIFALMKAEGLNAKEIAHIAGVVPSAVAKWKTGGKIGADKLERIANHFGKSVDWLLGREGSTSLARETRESDRPESQPVAAFQDGSADLDVPFDLPGAGERVVVKGVRYGSAPPYHDVPYEPQWNLNVGAMSDEDIVTELREGVDRIPKRKRGEARAHLCHYLMDFLNELANRKPKR